MQQIPSLMSQQPQAPPYGTPPTSQVAPGFGQQQQQHQLHQGQSSYPPSGFSQPQQGSWGPPTSGPGGQQQQPLISQRKSLSLSLFSSLLFSFLAHTYLFTVSIC